VVKIATFAKPENVSGQAMTTANKINFEIMIKENNKISVRQKEIVAQYLQQLDQHLSDLKEGKAEKTFEIKDLAGLLYVSPKHLSNTIQEVLGKSPCDIYEERLIQISKELLLETNNTISHIAQTLTFDPSNFTKFFKNYEGITPKQFRELQLKTELLTKQ
jgi:AraC family transcriptional regulator of adaptative response / methylphosphotriester-DNA alkyltransferase methyltransferase